MVRKPLLRMVEVYSARLIVSAYTDSEVTYLKTFKAAIEDDSITAKERTLLDTLAQSLGISDERISEIEEAFDSEITEVVNS